MRIYHEKHGWHHVNSVTEFEAHALNGWVKDEPPAPEIVAHIYLSDEDFIRAEYLKKFGKKPHHMAKLETIKKALNDDS